MELRWGTTCLNLGWSKSKISGSKSFTRSELGASLGMLYYVLGSPSPLWGQGVRGAPSSLPLLPAHSHSPLSIPVFLEPPWGLRKPPACSPCSQLAPLVPEHPWVPGTFLGPQEAFSLLLLLPACSPHPLSIPGSLEPSWGLRKLPTHSPHYQLAPLAPSLLPSTLNIPGSLEPPWGLRKPPACSPCSQLAPLAP